MHLVGYTLSTPGLVLDPWISTRSVSSEPRDTRHKALQEVFVPADQLGKIWENDDLLTDVFLPSNWGK